MKRFSTIALMLLLVVAFSLPASASAATSPGVKPGSFFYFFDTTFEKIGLFFTFSPENKARKALEYADERLAEAEAVIDNAEAVKTAITSYESNITFAAEKSKEVKDKGQAENLLASIEDNTSRNQEVLSAILIKVPEEAKEAITKAIEASKKGQEEAIKQIAELKQEVSELKQEITELKKQQKIGSTASTNAQNQPSIQELKKEIEELKKQAAIPAISATPIEQPTIPVVSTPKPVSELEPIPMPTPAPTSISQTKAIEISSISVYPTLNSAKIEWQTNILTNSKIFLAGRVYNSESGLSTRHIMNATGLISGTTYSYTIETIAGNQFVNKDGSFSTKPDEYTISIQPDKTSVPVTAWHEVTFKISTFKNGQDQSQQNIAVITPDPAQNKTINNSLYGWGNFYYRPKTVGTHTLVFSWNGVSKSIDIRATEYVKVDPIIQEVKSFNLSSGYSVLGSFKLSPADEVFALQEFKYETDLKDAILFLIPCNTLPYFPTPCNLTNVGTDPFKIQLLNYQNYTGIHTLTITEIKGVGINSGNYRYVSGLPVTFTFEVQ